MSDSRRVRTLLRRWWVPDAIYAITANTYKGIPLFADEKNVELLSLNLHKTQKHHPFHMLAYAYMPTHLHLLLHIPLGSNISKVMHSVQRNFTLDYKRRHGLTKPTRLWHRGFYDHVIRDEIDLANHFAYIHHNPVHHGYVDHPRDYPHTSFQTYVQRGWYGEYLPGDIDLGYGDFEGAE